MLPTTASLRAAVVLEGPGRRDRVRKREKLGYSPERCTCLSVTGLKPGQQLHKLLILCVHFVPRRSSSRWPSGQRPPWKQQEGPGLSATGRDSCWGPGVSEAWEPFQRPSGLSQPHPEEQGVGGQAQRSRLRQQAGHR